VTPEAFIAKWKAAELSERAAAHQHFVDLCRLLNEPTPAEADPKGEWHAFERGATKTTGGKGWADAWKRGHFGWEYKARGKDLTAAFAQLQQYAIALENPPLLVVCDLARFRIHTNWNNSISVAHEFALEDLRDPTVRQKHKAVLSDPEQLRPGKTRQALTEEAAAEFARLAQSLRARGHHPEAVAHLVNRLVFCMFAEGIGLLPNKLFAKMLASARTRPAQFEQTARQLFRAMGSPNGMVGFEAVEWFNGGLFDDEAAFPLTKDEIEVAARAAELDWAEIDPTIFGTLFERGLDPDKRSQLGAHYTDREKINLIVDPVIIKPWLTAWETVRTEVAEAVEKAKGAKSASARTIARNAAVSRYRAFLDRLRAFTVLDPACGSGNFLYVALRALKDLENRFMIEAEALGIEREFPHIGPAAVKGIEINAYAAELARVTVWIGEIQWMRRNGFDVSRNPILKPLDNIECRDALLNLDGTEAEWPDADVIIGNPPFLGDKRMISVLGEDQTRVIREVFKGRVPGGADLVVYWIEKAWRSIESGHAQRAGLVATQSVRRGASNEPLKRIAVDERIFEAWEDEPWVVEGAAVRVSIVCFGKTGVGATLNGSPVAGINADLNAALDLSRAMPLAENSGVTFQGTIKTGGFDVPGDLARKWLTAPRNPNGRPNADVLRPWANGNDVTGRPSGKWIVDFGVDRAENDASLYEAPFAHVRAQVRGQRSGLRESRADRRWWVHQRPLELATIDIARGEGVKGRLRELCI
jgi:type II restriction/modification system DNA methylase subunit YeeA